ncbi:18069_t:CDS:2 [Entrophospora sp. SA101]|nr:18067_t:CDS:2 [Entrophospora sp. SA101]CAJ0762600.1 18069_t:CDS:2 [Entrophospora sp. SA101]
MHGKIGKYSSFYNNNTGTGTYDPSFNRTWGRFRRDIDKVFDDFFGGGGIGGRDREGYGGAGIVGSPITWAVGVCAFDFTPAVDVKDTENKVIVHERHYGYFMRSLPLPTNVDRDKVDARLDLDAFKEFIVMSKIYLRKIVDNAERSKFSTKTAYFIQMTFLEMQIPTGSNLRLDTIWFVHPSNDILTIKFDLCAFYPGSVKYKCMQQGTRISDYFKKDEPPANETCVHSHTLTPCSSSLKRTNN